MMKLPPECAITAITLQIPSELSTGGELRAEAEITSQIRLDGVIPTREDFVRIEPKVG